MHSQQIGQTDGRREEDTRPGRTGHIFLFQELGLGTERIALKRYARFARKIQLSKDCEEIRRKKNEFTRRTRRKRRKRS